VTLARHAHLGGDRMQLLEEIAGALTRQDDFEAALRVVAGCSVPRFADLVTVVVQREGEDRLEVAHRDPEQQARAAGLIRPLLPTIRRVAEKDFRQGRRFRWIPRVARSSTPFLNRDSDLLRLLQALEVASIIVVPLRSSGV
jgi:hypothetical protein